MENLSDIIAKLGDPDKIGNDQIWVGKDYSKKDLILDLRKIEELQKDDLK